jgi:hypothetical protein
VVRATDSHGSILGFLDREFHETWYTYCATRGYCSFTLHGGCMNFSGGRDASDTSDIFLQ